MTTPSRHLAFLVLLAIAPGCLQPNVPLAPVSQAAGNDAADEATHKKLDEIIVDAEFDDVPFEDVVAQLAESSGLDILPRWRALETAVIERDVEINLHLGRARLRDALLHVLEQVGGGEVTLAAEVENGIVVISTLEDLARHVETRLYPIGDLVSRGYTSAKWEDAEQSASEDPSNPTGVRKSSERQNEPCRGMDDVATLITIMLAPESWMGVGGNVGSIAAWGDVLVVTQTAGTHREISALLDGLRAAHGLPTARPVSTATPGGQPVISLFDERLDEEAALERKLRETRVSMEFEESILADVFDELSQASGVTILVRWSALEIAAIQRDQEVTQPLIDVTAAGALRHLLNAVGGGEVFLDYEIRGGAVVVSTREDLDRHVVVRIYPVGDLASRGRVITRYGSMDVGGFDGPTTVPPEFSQSLARFDGVHGLAMLIVPTVAPESWRPLGGDTGAIASYGDALVIAATSTIHREITELLAGLRGERGLRAR